MGLSENPLLTPLTEEEGFHTPHVWTDLQIAKVLLGALAPFTDTFEVSVPKHPEGPIRFFIGPKNETRPRSSFLITIEELDCGY